MIQFLAGVFVGALGMLLCWVLCASAGAASRAAEEEIVRRDSRG